LKKNVEDYNSKPAQAYFPLSITLEDALETNSNFYLGLFPALQVKKQLTLTRNNELMVGAV